MMNAPQLLKAEMPLVRHVEAKLLAYGYKKGDADYDHAFETEIRFCRMFGVTYAVQEAA